ncbi:iron ABC transporter permease [Leptolyngbya sp. FACHB-321]|uniref:iron chelate uptake ABC transporter family permease subunit n=1 Tax=Leptolyngbya sp. FACHB-321 TaxID=2692807 RepID=UPI001685FB59|nr:iron ABC transporter permease [Leptolyngbya sp. FACHB-321]
MVKLASLSQKARSQVLLISGLVLCLLILLGCLMASILLGAAEIQPGSIFSALTAFDGSTDHLIIRTVRLPRSLIALMVGAALAVAGTITQGLTRNPLASPDILGINSGAAFAMVAVLSIFGSVASIVHTSFAFVGAGLTTVVVYLLGSLGRSGMTPLKLVVAGSALTYLLSSLTTGILILNQETLDEIRFWLAGSVAGRDIHLFLQVLPYMGVGLMMAFALGKPLTALALGEDVAKGLGLRTGWIKAIAMLVVVLLAGSAVAIAGPIWFIGLVVPHLARLLIGMDYRWLVPYAACLGAILLLLADIGARLIIKPQELPVGIMTSLLGAPFFIYLARSRVKQ